MSNTVKKLYAPPTAIDLFSGCGGLTCGLKQAGFNVIAAVELENHAADTFRANHKDSYLFKRDIQTLSGKEILKTLSLKKGQLDLLAGCPPCQGFSRLGTRNRKVSSTDKRNDLIRDFERIALDLLPKAIMLENVPALQKDLRFFDLCKNLKSAGYHISYSVVDVANFGVAQRRKRLILLASRVAPIDLVLSSGKNNSVRNVIGNLPKPGKSGDQLHDMSRSHSKKVEAIMLAIPKDGGSRSALPKSLVLNCHKKNSGFRDVYGRMSWDAVAPTITSGCTNPSKGRFIHPDQNRTITLREAALLQGFPKKYFFFPEKGLGANSLMIGNALPPPFIKHHAKTILNSILK